MSAQTRTLRTRGLVLSLVLSFAAVPAIAAPQASGDAYDLNVQVSILPALSIPALTVGAQADVAASLQSTGFHLTDEAGPIHLVNTAIAPLIHLDTGVLTAETEFVPPANDGGFLVVGSWASAANVDLGAVSLGSQSLLGVTADLIKSTAMVSGYCPPTAVAKGAGITNATPGEVAADVIFGNGFDQGNLNTSTPTDGGGGGGGGGGGTGGGDEGVSTVGVNVTVTGSPIANIPVSPAPNTQICILGNTACLTLNEQATSGDGVSTQSVSRNGLHLTANVLNVITADVIIAHAAASITCQ